MTKKATIHVIDDEPIIYEVLGELLTSEGYDVEISSDGKQAIEKCSETSYDLILLDMLMPGISGMEALKKIKKIDPNLIVIIITAYASIESAISAMKIGAYDYIQKPFKHDELLMTIQRAISHKKLQDENIKLKKELDKKHSFEHIIGKSSVMKAIFDSIKSVAPTRSTILIEGESGTGKELVARAIHQSSDRSSSPFVIVNSGSLPPDLLESHLFGHVKGAFTGATSLKIGLFEAADKGTIFFDEISTVNLETQAKLLRVMQDREFMRLGGTKTMKVDVRVIAATNINIEDLIKINKFREDLFYRLNVIKIELPPLRERKEDIPLLVKHFLDFFSKENKKEIMDISEDVMELFEEHEWPGNIRELENLIERAVVLSNTTVITRRNLPKFFTGEERPLDTLFSTDPDEFGLKEQTQDFQRRAIIKALKKARGVQKKAAQLLGIKPTTLNEMIKRLDIDTENIKY